MREVSLVKRLPHRSIVKYEGMARDENTFIIVLEYAENGSLGQTLKAFGKLNEKLVASYVFKILEGWTTFIAATSCIATSRWRTLSRRRPGT
ncbi:hypothetical protein H4582DRAFT_1979864 [Lactarius indigo]|nr:hypothetical protein H4582DRAFT_1979864 [Lactarius indigo]